MQYDFYQTSLSKCLSLIIDYRGRTPKKLGLDWSDDGYRAISANNVKFSGLTKIDDIKFGNQELYDLWMKKEVKKGDLLLTSEAPSGQVMIWDSDEKIILSQRLYALRVNDNFDNKYLKYYIQSEMGQKEIIKNNSGSTVFGISAKTFDNIIVYHPIKDIQEKIGNLLYTIDKKIALNKQINARLEQMAKTLYDYWFVQFDFPDTDGKPYKSSGGEMVFDETLKREIPKGWKSGNILNIANLLGGGTPSKSSPKYWNGNIPFFTPTDCDNSIFILDTADRITDAGLCNSSTRLFKKHSIFITARGSVGRSSINAVPMAMNQSCYAFQAKENVSYTFLFFLIRELIMILEVKATGSVFNSIVSSDIETTNLVISNKDLIRKFGEYCEPLFNQIETNLKQNHQLTQLRDFLLPMLMNGQVSVAE
jgi:type I restriction modification DNA specificity domain protein